MRDELLQWLRSELPDHVEVHEIGSTAVTGAVGKGDLDLLVRVAAADFKGIRTRLDAITPRNPDQFSSVEYQGYLVTNSPDAAIQLTVAGGPHDNFLTFVEALGARSELVDRYNELKRCHHGGPMSDYRNAKRQFIEAVLAGQTPEGRPQL